MNRILERNNVLKGTKIMTTDGRDLGTMIDLYFDEQSGGVEGYEVSGGVFADAYSGRSFVPAPHTIKIGEDVAFVPPETADLMEEQVGGIKGAVQSAGEQLQETTQTAGERLQTATQSATTALTNQAVDPAQQKMYVVGKTANENITAPDGTLLVARSQQVTPLAADEAERQGVLDKLYYATGGSLTTGLGSAFSGAIAGSAVEAAQGRRVQRAVRTNEGVIIAAPSQIVTEQVVNRARTYHKEAELLEATGLSTSDAARVQASDTVTGAGDRIRNGTEQAREGASNLWGRVKERVSDLQERTAQEAEEAQIKHALGRPTDRVILDPQDNVILNVGELITHQAIDRARQVGVLDILLGSGYDKVPEITKDELRAPERGEASLQQRQHNAES
jgi:sporulation protein YlmC with PRC-barrel domain